MRKFTKLIERGNTLSRKFKYFSQVLEAIERREIQLKSIDYKEMYDSYKRLSTVSLIDSVIALEYSLIKPLQESIEKYKKLKAKFVCLSTHENTGEKNWDWLE